MLTAGASLLSWIWQSSLLTGTKQLVAILLLLWLHWSPWDKADGWYQDILAASLD